jgi:hypothetical protein
VWILYAATMSGERTDTKNDRTHGCGYLSDRLVKPRCPIGLNLAYHGEDDEEIIPSRRPLDHEAGVHPEKTAYPGEYLGGGLGARSSLLWDSGYLTMNVIVRAKRGVR